MKNGITCDICKNRADERAIDFWAGMAVCKNCGYTHDKDELGQCFEFDLRPTGGGCEALVRNFGRGVELWLTDAGGMSVPDLGDKVLIKVHWIEIGQDDYAMPLESDESAATLSDAGHMLARWFMSRWDFEQMSLDEWLVEHRNAMSRDERRLGANILKFCMVLL